MEILHKAVFHEQSALVQIQQKYRFRSPCHLGLFTTCRQASDHPGPGRIVQKTMNSEIRKEKVISNWMYNCTKGWGAPSPGMMTTGNAGMKYKNCVRATFLQPIKRKSIGSALRKPGQEGSSSKFATSEELKKFWGVYLRGSDSTDSGKLSTSQIK